MAVDETELRRDSDEVAPGPIHRCKIVTGQEDEFMNSNIGKGGSCP